MSGLLRMEHKMSGHVFARLNGYAYSLLPFAPYSIDRVDNTSDTVIRVSSGDRSVVLDFTRPDFAPRLTHAQSVSEVVEISPGDEVKRWSIETTSFQTTWPRGFSVRSAEWDWPLFELVATEGSVIWFQGCFPNATAERMTAPGSVLRAQGDSRLWHWYEFAYEHDHTKYLQRWYVKSFDANQKLIITAQAPEAQCDPVFHAAEEFAESFKSKSAQRIR